MEDSVYQEYNETNTSIPIMCCRFIYTPIAYSISGVFVWCALVLTCFQIFQHLRYYSVPEKQLWIVRILFIVPVYGLCSWLGLLFPYASVYFDAIRSCYEAFVIYNFVRLCIAYVGGESAILAEINGKSIPRSCWAGTCCFPRMTYSIRFLRFCMQSTLQFCFVKPVVAIVIIVLEALGLYNEGNWDPQYGYIYCTLIYNVSVSLALYGLVLFYTATQPLLSKYHPVLKFLCIKSVIFLSFWQGVLLAVLHWVGLIATAEEAAAYQNFLITMEMLAAAILLWFAFPYRLYQDLRKDGQGRGIPMQNISSHFRDTLNPHDVVNDAIHNFSRVYQQYAIQGDLSEQDKDNSSDEKRSQDGNVPSSSSSNKSGMSFSLSRKKKSEDQNYERVILLVESDEDEIL